jgi:hypothetical protein
MFLCLFILLNKKRVILSIIPRWMFRQSDHCKTLLSDEYSSAPESISVGFSVACIAFIQELITSINSLMFYFWRPRVNHQPIHCITKI